MLSFAGHAINAPDLVKSAIQNLSQAQRERLGFLELRAYFTGELRRADIEARFGIKPAASSRDLSAYRDLEPDNLDYDVAARCYRPTKAFKPLFEFSTDRVLAWLLQGFGDGLDLRLRKPAPCEGPGNLVRPDLAVLATVTRAMCARRALKVSYLSLSSGLSARELVPVALADNGLRWHVRAFDRSNTRFGDFVLTRIAKAKEIEGPVEDAECLAADEQWSRVVELEVVPHPLRAIGRGRLRHGGWCAAPAFAGGSGRLHAQEMVDRLLARSLAGPGVAPSLAAQHAGTDRRRECNAGPRIQGPRTSQRGTSLRVT
jgi:hypothetical protein